MELSNQTANCSSSGTTELVEGNLSPHNPPLTSSAFTGGLSRTLLTGFMGVLLFGMVLTGDKNHAPQNRSRPPAQTEAKLEDAEEGAIYQFPGDDKEKEVFIFAEKVSEIRRVSDEYIAKVKEQRPIYGVIELARASAEAGHKRVDALYDDCRKIYIKLWKAEHYASLAEMTFIGDPSKAEMTSLRETLTKKEYELSAARREASERQRALEVIENKDKKCALIVEIIAIMQNSLNVKICPIREKLEKLRLEKNKELEDLREELEDLRKEKEKREIARPGVATNLDDPTETVEKLWNKQIEDVEKIKNRRVEKLAGINAVIEAQGYENIDVKLDYLKGLIDGLLFIGWNH